MTDPNTEYFFMRPSSVYGTIGVGRAANYGNIPNSDWMANYDASNREFPTPVYVQTQDWGYCF